MHGPKLQYSNTNLKHLPGFGFGVHTYQSPESQFKIHILWHFGLSTPLPHLFFPWSLTRSEIKGEKLCSESMEIQTFSPL